MFFSTQFFFPGGCWVLSWWFHKSLCAPRSHLCVWDLTRSPLATLIPGLFFPYVHNLFGFAYNEFHRGYVAVSLSAISPCFISSNCLSSRFPVDQQFRQIKETCSLCHLLLLHQAWGKHPVPKRFWDCLKWSDKIYGAPHQLGPGWALFTFIKFYAFFSPLQIFKCGVNCFWKWKNLNI